MTAGGGWNATDDQGYRYRDDGQGNGQGNGQHTRGFFSGPLREYIMSLGRPVSLLQAGHGAPLSELGIGTGQDVSSVTAVDTDLDLRTVPIPPRAFDVVYCANLLERIEHVELVLDRLISALRPGGLLLICTHDRQTAYAFLDRILPAFARKALWKRLRPGLPGPFPAIYEKMLTERGIASYTMMRGLVISQRSAQHSLPTAPRRISSSVRITCAVISGLTRGRFGNAHDELLYVIRKPQDRFARVV